MGEQKRAEFIARRIFQVGGKVQRIQFMGGEYPDHETKMGGLCLDALVRVVTCALAELDEAQEVT